MSCERQKGDIKVPLETTVEFQLAEKKHGEQWCQGIPNSNSKARQPSTAYGEIHGRRSDTNSRPKSISATKKTRYRNPRGQPNQRYAGTHRRHLQANETRCKICQKNRQQFEEIFLHRHIIQRNNFNL